MIFKVHLPTYQMELSSCLTNFANNSNLEKWPQYRKVTYP